MNMEPKRAGFDRIKIELREVYEILERADRENELSAIERDIALERLRGIYGMLKTATVSEHEADRESVGECNALPKAIVTESKEAERPVRKSEIEFVGRAVLPEDEIPFSVNRPWDKRVIDSLYGDGEACRKNDPGEGRPTGGAYVVPEEVPETETPQSGEPASVAFGARAEDVSGADAVSSGTDGAKGTRVLGEVMAGNNRQTVLNEAVSGKDNRPDLASVLSSRTVSDVRKSIGINDRFLLMRDLFGNDSALYDRTMDALNGCGSFEDACIYLQENFVFDPEREGIKLLVSLLERKFS